MPLPEFGEAFFGARRTNRRRWRQRGLKTFAKTLGHGPLLSGFGLVNSNTSGLLARLRKGLFDRCTVSPVAVSMSNRLLGIKLPGTFAADHQITVALAFEPVDMASVAIPASMTTRAPGGALRPVYNRCQGACLGNIAANVCELRTKPLPSSTRPNVHQTAVTYAFPWSRARWALRLFGNFAFEIGVG